MPSRQVGGPGSHVVPVQPSQGAPRIETVQQALDAALLQLGERDDAAVLRQRGANPVHELGAVFDGKRAWVRAG